MEYQRYKLNNTEVIAIRQFWGEGEEKQIIEKVENAIVQKKYDHMFLIPINANQAFVPKLPSIILGGELFEKEESCHKCLHRVRKLTSNCISCEFSSFIDQAPFKIDEVEELLNSQKSKKINILKMMEKTSISEIYDLYHLKLGFSFKNKTTLTIDQFKEFIEKFDIYLLFETKDEAFLESNGIIFQVQYEGEYVKDQIEEKDEIKLKEIYDSVIKKIDVLKEKRELIHKLLKQE